MSALVRSLGGLGGDRISLRRVRAIILQNTYTMRRSPLRLMELFYWPLLEVILWGFITSYLARSRADLPGGVGVLLGAVVLWDVMFRSQQELAMTCLIDMWDRNVLNLYASPLRQSEYVLAGVVFSAVRVVLGSLLLVVVTRIAFGFDLLTAGAVLPPALLILVGMGWSLGLLIRAGIMRFGSNAEVLAWSAAFLLQPLSAVFYPVDVLPDLIERVSYLVPASHVFEALRAFLATGEVAVVRLAVGAALDVGYLILSALVLKRTFRTVREKGLLSRPGY